MPSTNNKNENAHKISRYLLNSLLVEQAVSAIYLAKDEKSDDTVFLVTLQPEAIKSSDLADRFLRRAETLAQLEHETILPVLDHGLDGKRPYVVMAYLPGQFLAEHLLTSAKPDPTDKTAVINSLQLVKQLAAGLAVAHPAGLIHHDLRPENIYLDDTGKPYLLDLVVPPTPSVSSQLDTEHPKTLDYQSPEQQAGKALSGKSNIFSLGILLYRLLAGQLPALPASEWDIFEHKGMAREVPLQQVQPELTGATYTAVQDSLWQKEWSRFETIASQIRAIDRAIKAESAPPPPPPPAWLQLVNRLRQPKNLKIIIAAVVVLILLVLALMMVRGRANRQQNNTPTPDTAVSPAEVEATISSDPADPPADLESTPTLELLPTATEVVIPTASPVPTNTAVPPTPTQPLPTETIVPTLQATISSTVEETQTSCVPSPPFGWVRYAIQSNDSLSSLGQATNTTVEQLQEINCLDSTLLSIGQEIWLPAITP